MVMNKKIVKQSKVLIITKKVLYDIRLLCVSYPVSEKARYYPPKSDSNSHSNETMDDLLMPNERLQRVWIPMDSYNVQSDELTIVVEKLLIRVQGETPPRSDPELEN